MPWPKGKPIPAEMRAKQIASLVASGAGRRKPKLVDGIEHWQCVRCERWLLREVFYADKTQSAGIKSECKTCHARTSIESRDPDRACDTNRAYMRRARAKDPEKFRARNRERSRARVRSQHDIARAALNAAVRAGAVRRPEACSRCGRAVGLNAHHEDYSKPLDVVWLCTECHGLAHRAVAFKRTEASK